MCYKDVGVNRRCCAGSGTGVMGTTAKPCTRELFMCLVKGIEDDVKCKIDYFPSETSSHKGIDRSPESHQNILTVFMLESRNLHVYSQCSRDKT